MTSTEAAQHKSFYSFLAAAGTATNNVLARHTKIEALKLILTEKERDLSRKRKSLRPLQVKAQEAGRELRHTEKVMGEVRRELRGLEDRGLSDMFVGLRLASLARGARDVSWFDQ